MKRQRLASKTNLKSRLGVRQSAHIGKLVTITDVTQVKEHNGQVCGRPHRLFRSVRATLLHLPCIIAVQGTRGTYWVNLRHGVSRLLVPRL
ncbi:MAG: hypothetical protein ABIW02_02850 [Nitrosospira sp.]